MSGGGGESASSNYAPVMFIVGTGLMSAGMWGCAALTGRATDEVRFRRQWPSPSPSPSFPGGRLLWLQPGPQVVCDQSFDTFAYFDSDRDPLMLRKSSRKGSGATRTEVYTVAAVSMATIGYVMQFIGLRGIKA